MTDSKPLRILVVDDVQESAFITKAMLAKGDFRAVDWASNGRQALELCGIDSRTDSEIDSDEPAPYALVILDIMMPDIDGLEVCARMRLSRRTRELPILMLTAANDVQLLNQAFMAGADDFLTKPIDEFRLLARTRNLLRVQREQERRALREEELRIQNTALREGTFGASFIQPATGLLRERVLDVILADCRANAIPAAFCLVQILDFQPYSAMHGDEAAETLAARVATLLQDVEAPTAVMLFAYRPGAFILLQPGARDADACAEWARRASAAVAAAAIPHGNSIEANTVTIRTEPSHGAGNDLAHLIDQVTYTTKTQLLEAP